MRKYDGERAFTYEKTRVNNEAWQWQQVAVESILHRYKPCHVLDAPVGTGRFFGVYREIGADVIGIDVSRDMLDIARAKGFDYTLLVADLFEARWPNFVVSTRFFGHLTHRKKIKFLAKVREYLLFSHGFDAYEYIAKENLEIIETHEMGDGRHCVSLVKRNGVIPTASHKQGQS